MFVAAAKWVPSLVFCRLAIDGNGESDFPVDWGRDCWNYDCDFAAACEVILVRSCSLIGNGNAELLWAQTEFVEQGKTLDSLSG